MPFGSDTRDLERRQQESAVAAATAPVVPLDIPLISRNAPDPRPPQDRAQPAWAVEDRITLLNAQAEVRRREAQAAKERAEEARFQEEQRRARSQALAEQQRAAYARLQAPLRTFREGMRRTEQFAAQPDVAEVKVEDFTAEAVRQLRAETGNAPDAAVSARAYDLAGAAGLERSRSGERVRLQEREQYIPDPVGNILDAQAFEAEQIGRPLTGAVARRVQAVADLVRLKNIGESVAVLADPTVEVRSLLPEQVPGSERRRSTEVAEGLNPVARVIGENILVPSNLLPTPIIDDLARIGLKAGVVPVKGAAKVVGGTYRITMRQWERLAPASREAIGTLLTRATDVGPGERGGLTPDDFIPGGEAVSPASAVPPPGTAVSDTTSAGIQSIATRMRGMIATARRLGPEQARMISEQKAQRVAGASKKLEQGSGLESFHASKSLLAGEYDKPVFEPLNLPAEDVNAFVDFIKASDAEYFDKLGALTAIEKATLGIKPQSNELDKLDAFIPGLDFRKAFDEQAMAGPIRGVEGGRSGLLDLPSTGMQTRLAESIDEAYVGAIAAGNGTPTEIGKWTRRLQAALSPFQLVKTVATSFDIGWGGRQGWRLMPRNAVQWFSMYGKQYRAFASDEAFTEIEAATKAFPNFERSQSMERPLAYLQRGTGSPETSGEEYTSALTRKIWGLRGSERAYVAPGNWMRQAVLDKQVARLVKVNKAPVSDADFQLLIDAINNATLRGNTKWLGNTNASTLASLLFSLKGQVSGPQFAMDAVRAAVNGGDAFTPEARKIVMEQFGAYVGMGMTMLGLAAATGYGLNKQGVPEYVSVDLNKDSKTFGEISVGEMRWNYWGADLPLVRYALQVTQGKREPGAGIPAQGVDRLRLTQNLIGSKIAPGVPAALWTEFVRDGYDPFGQRDINTPKGAAMFSLDQITPLLISNGIDAYNDRGPWAVAPTLLANVSGFTTATYDNTASGEEAASAAKAPAREALQGAGVPFSGNEIDFSRPYMDAGREMLANTLELEPALLEGKSLAEVKAAYIEVYMADKPKDKTEREWERELALHFNGIQHVKDMKAQAKEDAEAYWKAHPDELRIALETGHTTEAIYKDEILEND